MENDTLDALQYIGYTGPLLDEGKLDEALQGSFKSPEFRHAVVWLTAELKVLCKLDEQVNDISSAEEASSFLLELGSFLKEIGCQYKFLTEGHVTERLQSHENCLLLLHYLVTELQAARMVSVKQPSSARLMEIKLQETSTASELKNMLITLKFPKPPDNISPAVLFGKVEQKLKDVVSRAHPELVSKPLFKGVLSDKNWHVVSELQQELHQEYRVRREMLIKRLDVTIQSFQWSDRVKNKGEQIASAMAGKRKTMCIEPDVRLADLLAAREDLAIIEKTSSASVRKNTQSDLNKVIIGKVPDRGGRTTDQAPPPPEMPSWQKDRNPGGGRGGFSGGGGGGRGGGRGRGGNYGGGDRNRVQGGWNQGSNDRGQGWNQGSNDRGQNLNQGINDRGQGWNQSNNDRGKGWNQGSNDRGKGWSQGSNDRKSGGYQGQNASNLSQSSGYHGDGGYHGGARGGGGHHRGGRGGRRDDRDGGRRDYR